MSYTLQINNLAPDFNLKSTNGKYYSLKDFEDSEILVIFFTCNHCPYVLNSDEDTRKIVEKYLSKKVRFIAINSNSPNTYETDSYENMVIRMRQYKFPWVYLHDENQEVVKLYGALCTPHFFVFNDHRKLVYTGRAVDSPRNIADVKERSLELALDEILSGKPITTQITNPIGCNIKWDGKPKHWMPKEAVSLV